MPDCLKSAMSKMFLDQLFDPKRKEIFQKLSVFKKMAVLGGGTAIALQLGHRKSYDLDLFTAEKELIVPFSYVFEEKFKNVYSVKVIRRFETFVEFEITKETEAHKVQLAYDSPFRFEKPIISDLGVMVNDYKDLMADKVLAFFGRAEPRDAIDAFFILKSEPFEELCRLAAQKDPGFDLYWFAVALQKTKSFPDEIDRWPVEMLKEINTLELKDKFANLSIQIMERIRKC